MIKQVLVGSLFETDAQTLVNTVNCVGVMGKGIALEFKNRFPEMFRDYVERCNRRQVRLGEPYIFRSLFPPHVVNFPTKDHWRSVSRIADIIQGLTYLARHYAEWGITSLAVPPLGCGSGGLEWRIVGPTLARHLHRLEIPVYLFAPHGTPAQFTARDFLLQTDGTRAVDQPKPVPVGWIATVEVLDRILASPLHWPVGRVNLQKIAYFVTQAGIHSGFDYQRGSYGPFSPGLKRALSALVNQGLIVEEPKGKMISVKVGPTFRDARLMFARELGSLESTMARVVDLLHRVPSTRDAELAATVHFMALELGDGATEAQLLGAVMEWKQRRRPGFSREEVALAIRNLAALGWIKVTASADMPLRVDIETFV